MTPRVTSRTDRRKPLGIGHEIATTTDSAKVVGVTRDAQGRVVVCLDYGDHRTRVPWIELAKNALSTRPANASDILDEHPSPLPRRFGPGMRAALERLLAEAAA
ncbi:hypothetical protein N803_14510 [Knoellia subterranea KCTC 19937]|uniref:Uncharacterized protein n=1 Tax=Knoellia subterranea KCTC 19937 TaxID=1385521 RepID=A0A0A0JKK4_9MICO|nr:hypothetical protein N803_14510 [Knoellia subterranea KCTC 19937]